MAEPNIGASALEADRRRRAAKLRDKGYAWPEIAESCGYEHGAEAARDVLAWEREARTEYAETVDDLRELERRRYERYTRLAEQQYEAARAAREDYELLDPSEKRGVAAPDPTRELELLRKLADARGKLLGLEAPKSVEVTSHTTYDLNFNPEDLA